MLGIELFGDKNAQDDKGNIMHIPDIYSKICRYLTQVFIKEIYKKVSGYINTKPGNYPEAGFGF
jgi:hypothetical protein